MIVNKGIDLSHFQSEKILNWDQIKKDGIDFVYIKATQGIGFVDPLATQHAIGATKQGMAIGYYHFADVNADAITEGKFFATQLSSLPKFNLLPVLDIESNKSGLTSSEIETWILTFENTMLSFGHKIMLYSYTPFLDQYLPRTHQFGRMPLWLAQYRNVTSPMLPHGFNSACLWQYTNQGKVNGINGLVDMNKAISDDCVIKDVIV